MGRDTMRRMPLPPDITFEDFRKLVEMVQTTIAELSDLCARVKALEEANEAHYSAAVALRDNLEKMFEAQKAQQEVNSMIRQSIDQLLQAMRGNTWIQ
jgi:regulator of replication initiation timing